jgi:PAS domain S-box-containing protein
LIQRGRREGSLETGQPHDSEHRLRSADGTYRWFYLQQLPLRDVEGTIIRWYVLLISIDDRKRAEEALRHSEERIRLVVDSIAGHIAIMTPEGKVEFVNQQCLDYFGKTAEELQSWCTNDSVHLDDLPHALVAWKHSIETGDTYHVDHRLRRADGEYRWFHASGRPLRDAQGQIIRWYVLLTDIDERKRAEQKLCRSEEYLLEAHKLSHTGSWGYDVATRTVTLSPEIRRIFGIKPENDASKSDFFLGRIHADDRSRIAELFEESGRQKTGFETDHRIILPDGTIKHLYSICHPILSDSGKVVEYIGTTMDVTQQVQARLNLEHAFGEIKHLKDRLHNENVVLREQIDQAFMFEEIVGSSISLQKVLSSLVKVAPTDSTVLITGETGTGKELIARAIHKRSQRSGRAFVSVNCASIPSSLIASELFGHEKGAFTGALQQRQGRFELAHSGTIFLDEVGELPAETQVALLRVLQERQFERVGSSRFITADVRVIAATNRNLSAAIAAGTFRADLFYRLNVFPIQMPPLRERKEDIPLLVEYFVKRFSDKMGKQIRRIDKETLNLCQGYHWPGNIRELQNIIERAVILSGSDTFSIDESWLSIEKRSGPTWSGSLREALLDQEKKIIETALVASKGKIAGRNGAAARLGIPPSTLDSKIKQLQIKREQLASRF